MHNLIHHDQPAYVKSCYIGESIVSRTDTLEFADDNDIPGIPFLADFRKGLSLLNTLSFSQEFWF